MNGYPFLPTHDEWIEHWMEEAEENRGEGDPEPSFADAEVAWKEREYARAEALGEAQAEARRDGYS